MIEVTQSLLTDPTVTTLAVWASAAGETLRSNLSVGLVAKLFIGVGLAFDLLGTIGLVRLPDIYNRVQAATKCVTLGTCMILFGVFLHFGVNALGVKALIAIVFVLLSSPVGAHALARGAHVSGVPLWKGSVGDAYREFRRGRTQKGSPKASEDGAVRT